MASKLQQPQHAQGNNKNEKLKAIAKDVRSVLNSSKPPCYLVNVLNDYKTILDVPLPYKAMGYKSPEDLLLDTGEFQITKINGRTSIYALHAPEASKHIKDMVLRQKKSKNAAKQLKMPRAPRNPVYNRSSSGGDRNNNQVRMNYNLPQRQVLQQRKPQVQQQQQQQQQKNNMNNNNEYDLRMRLNRMQIQQQQQQQAEQQQQLRQSHAQEQQQRQQQLLRQQHQQQQQQSMKINQNINSKPRAILGNGVQQQQQPQQQSLQQQQKDTTNTRPQLSTQKSLTNIQDRLKVTAMMQQQQQQFIKIPPLRQTEQKVFTMQQQPQLQQPVLPPKVFQFNPNLDPIKSLSQYCIVRQFTQPQYKTINNRKKYQCRVQVNGSIYSTYPHDFNSEHEAQMACAKIAVEEIKQQETRNPLPVSTDADEVLVDKLYKELLKHTHGIFVKNMPETFETAYQQALPDHWWTLVQMSKCFITECVAGDKVVIFANLKVSTQESASPAKNNGFKKSIKVELEKLRLPWEEKHWNVHVTYVESALKVYVRLIGNEYSDQYDAICKTMESEVKTQASKVIENEIYLAFVSDGWHRVRVVTLEESKERALCYYLDFGDTDWLPLVQLYVCDAKYLILPAQAVALSLFGLEDFQEHPCANSILYNQLQNRTLVAEILCKEFDYAQTQKSVKAVLFDTNSDSDINMNSELLDMICDSVGAPELKSSGITKVQVTAINDNGSLYVRLIGSSLTYVEKMINQLVASKFKRDQHCVNKLDLQRSDMFLICDNSNEETRWYRGRLARMPHSDDIFDIYYVDHGFTRAVHMSQMFRLDSLSTALSKFPAQAIKVQLHNIPPISKSIVGRMRALLPTNCEALVKLVQPAEVPYVTVYRRIEGPDTLCTINDTIRIEYELESSLDTNTDFTGAAEVNSAHSSNNSINQIETNSTPNQHQVFSNNVPKTKTNIYNQNQKNIKSDDDFKHLTIYNEIPTIGSFFDVRVALASNPTNFIVQPYLKYKELCVLMKNLQIYCEQNLNNNVPADQIQIGQAYAAKNPDGYYHRVIVEKIFSTDMINVRYCDFGDMAVLRYTELKHLPAEFRHLPQMAIAARLYDAQPKEGDWTMNDCTRFRELTVGKNFVGALKGISKESHNDILLDLELIDVETEDDIYIKQILQAEKRLK